MSILIAFVIFTTLLGLASQLGWSVDSRDGADCRVSDGR